MGSEKEDLFDPALLREPNDGGKTEMVLFPHEGKVIVRYREPRLFVAFDPSNAVDVGKKLIDCAVECGAEVQIQVPRREISKGKRDALITRATHVLRSMTEQRRSPAHIARHVVDSILSAID